MKQTCVPDKLATADPAILHTARLVLRPARATDLQDISAILRDPDAMRYWSTPPHPDLATSQAWLQSMMDRPAGTDFILEMNGRVIGKAGAWQMPEVGFLLSPKYWRQGLMSEAMTTIIPHLWRVSDDPMLTADVDPRNAASIGVLQALGFKQTGRAKKTFLINDVWADSVYFGLERPTE